MVIPLFLGQQVPQEKVQDAMEDLNLSLQKLEEKFLQEKPFIIGNEISLADLVAVVELMQVRPQEQLGGRRPGTMGPVPSRQEPRTVLAGASLCGQVGADHWVSTDCKLWHAAHKDKSQKHRTSTPDGHSHRSKTVLFISFTAISGGNVF